MPGLDPKNLSERDRRAIYPEPMDNYMTGSLDRALKVIEEEGLSNLSDYEKTRLAVSLLGACMRHDDSNTVVVAAEEIAGMLGNVADAVELIATAIREQGAEEG